MKIDRDPLEEEEVSVLAVFTRKSITKNAPLKEEEVAVFTHESITRKEEA